MANILGHAVIGCGLAGALVVGAVAPSSAQGVYANPYYYSAPQGYAGYNGYAYSPGYVARSWDYPAGYDTGGMPYSYRDLGWRPDGTVCYPTLRAQNRC